MDKVKTNLAVKVKHLLKAFRLVEKFAYSSDKVEIRTGLETLKFRLTTVFPAGGQSRDYPVARKMAEFTLWRIDQILKNKIDLHHANHALLQDVRTIWYIVDGYRYEKSKGGNKPPTHHKDSSK